MISNYLIILLIKPKSKSILYIKINIKFLCFIIYKFIYKIIYLSYYINFFLKYSCNIIIS